MKLTISDIVKAVKERGFPIYTQPYKLNVVGIRNSNPINQDKFDDILAYFYYDNKGNAIGRVAVGTTDPSTRLLKEPMSKKGAAILKGGAYIDTYAIDYHNSKYLALCQRLKPVTVFRDNDRDGYTNFLNKEETGFFGINIHRASRGKSNEAIIDLDSAGCQVFMRESDFDEMMRMAKVSRERHGNKFSYILLDDTDLKRARNTNLILIGAGVLAIGLAGYFYSKNKRLF